jgi:hypothetical protein
LWCSMYSQEPRNDDRSKRIHPSEYMSDIQWT